MVLEPVWQGYIQAEDVVELRSWSEYALQKLGHNFNYLKKDLDDQNTNVNGFYLTNGQNIDNGFAIPNTTSHGSPNGKAFYAGGFTNVFNGFDIGISFVLSGYTSWQLATGTIAGYMTSTISGSNITNTAWVHELVWAVSYNA